MRIDFNSRCRHVLLASFALLIAGRAQGVAFLFAWRRGPRIPDRGREQEIQAPFSQPRPTI